MLTSDRLIAAAFWVVLAAVALATRPPLPVDETRYLAVAWEMWRDGNYLVPHLNGDTYSHKPPLLFWLMTAGWTVFGVVEWWPRLIAPLFGLACLPLAAALARGLWPDEEKVAAAVPVIVVGSLFWTLFTTLTMFDMLLACFALIGLIGLARAWRQGGAGGFLLFGLAIGFGVLAKGPAILVHVLPAALLAPWWGPALAPPRGSGFGRWYAGVGAGVLLGATIGLAWAVPAGFVGGDEYREAIFWGQSADRMIESFAHRRPWWWYAAALPAMVLPWTLWPVAWRAFARLGRGPADGGVRFAAAWLLPAVVVFSAISGKQLHYLLPEIPALALIAARLITGGGAGSRQDLRVPAAVACVAGVVAAGLGVVPAPPRLAALLEGAAPAWMLVLAAAGLALALRPPARMEARLSALAALSVAMVVAVHLALSPLLAAAYDLRPVAQRLAAWQASGHPLAFIGKYHGQFDFLGRLADPITLVGDDDVAEWMARNPTGKIITQQDELPADLKPDLVSRFRRDMIVVWSSEVARIRPEVVRRPQ